LTSPPQPLRGSARGTALLSTCCRRRIDGRSTCTAAVARKTRSGPTARIDEVGTAAGHARD
jgi:hypothetical protein